MLIAILIVVNIPVFLVIGWLIFDTGDGFLEALKSYLTPDIIHTINGEQGEGVFAALKVVGFVSACGGLVYGEYLLALRWFF